MKHWNWDTFGNTKQRIAELNNTISSLEQQIQLSWSEDLHCQWENRKKELLQFESWENERLCTQARLDWAQHGYTNSKFFHAVSKERRHRQLIQIRQEDGQVTTNSKDIGKLAEQFYGDLFSPTPYHIEEDLFHHITESVTDQENSEFCAIPSADEVLTTIQPDQLTRK